MTTPDRTTCFGAQAQAPAMVLPHARLKPRTADAPQFWKTAIVAAACFLAGWLRVFLRYGHDYASPMETTAGVALASMLLAGWRVWPGVLVGAFGANLLAFHCGIRGFTPPLLLGAAMASMAQTFQAGACCWFASRFAAGARAFERPRTIFLYVAGAGLAGSAIEATARSLSITAASCAPWNEFGFLWLAWWLATICGFVAVTPSILAWRNVESRGVTVARLGEFGVLLLLLVFVTNLVFGDIFPGQISSTLAFLLIPMLLWAALRFGRRGTALAVLVLAAMAIYATLHGSGPFAMPNRRASLLLLQSFILIVSMLAFVVQADAFERRGALSALQTSESRYRELFEGNPEPMWVYDDETLLFLDANNAAIQSYGFTKGEFLGMRVGDIRLPEESEIAETQSGETFQVQCRHRKRDGSIIYAETTRHRVLMEGRRAWLVLSTDITERKRAENHSLTFSMLGRKLSAARSSKEAAAIMFEAADALFRWDSAVFELLMPGTDKAITILCVDTIQGQRREVLFDNPLRSLGTEGMKALRGPKLVLRPPHSLFPEGTIPFGDTTRPSESLMFAPVKNGAKTIGSLSLQSYTQNAFTEGDLHSLQALADHCGGALERIRAEAENERLTIELREHVENLRSFNEKLEQRVQERTSQLQTINKELEAFSYSVSHDLRAPLRSIRGFSEVLLERHSTQLDARGQDYLRRVCQSSEQMDKLIEDLLKLSRVGRAELQWRDVDLTAMAETIVDELRKNNPERHVEIKIAPGLRAYGDERLLRIVLDNLLQNAWKFTSKTAGPCITVERVPGSPPAFCVRDNGAGFDMRHANRLFGVFQRLHTTSEFPGTGVGLATAQRILNRHGGRLWAEAQVDRGATFYFTLPAHEPS